MDQIQSQSQIPHLPYNSAVYINALHQVARETVQSAWDKVPLGSWLQRHLYLELYALEQGVGKLNEKLSAAKQQEPTDTPVAVNSTASIEGPPAVLEHCTATLRNVLANIAAAFASTDGSLNTKLAWYGAAVTSSMALATSAQDTLLRLSFFRPDPPVDFQYQTRDPFSTGSPAPSICLRHNRGDGDVDQYTVSKWLSPFIQLINHEPGEFYCERFTTQRIEKTFHGLSQAALKWPLHANHFWPGLEDQVLKLFVSDPTNYGFINWLLLFAREKWPEEFGWHAPAKGPLIELTDALCKGSISPLHVAATFALHSLCDRLISLGADLNATGPLGTPLWCALVGPDILLNRMAGKAWHHTRDPYFSSCRSPAVTRLLDAGADYSIGIGDTGDQNLSLSGMAFLVAYETGDETILHRIIQARPVFDQALNHVIESLNQHDDRPDQGVSVSRLLTILLDECIRVGSNKESQALGDAISEAMSRLKLELNPASRDGRLPLPDEALTRLVVAAIVGDDALALRRCVLDPRFDPNPPAPETGRVETALHLAVADDFFEAVDILIEAGADHTIVDEGGRTPLMAVESVGMLEKLVLKHGAVTTDSDFNGRTIWHMAAATNDATLLEWLCVKDPLRQDNMNKRTIHGRTPLVEAFLSIDDLDSIPLSLDNMKPKAAEVLLNLGGKELSLSGGHGKPLPHLAVPWGDAGLLSSLHDLGADFSALDEDGWTPLHHLNFSATSEFVEKLMEFCPEVSWMTYAGLTPAETIIQNVRTLPATDAFARSSHPSCMHGLSAKAYNRLLDPEMLRQCDANGEGFWPRFCKNVLIRMYNQAEGQNKMIMLSIETALQCLLSKGIMLEYEKKTSKPGILCLEGSGLRDQYTEAEIGDGTAPFERFWNLKIFRRILIKVLRHSSKAMKRLFWTTAACQRLLVECCVDGELTILRYLCSRNLGISIDDRRYLGLTVLEAAINNFEKTSLEPLKSVLVCTPVDHLIQNQMAILRAILEAHEKKGTGKELLQFFVDRGMRVNPDMDDGESMLAEAIKDGKPEVVEMLLGHGAKLDPGLNGFNALIATVQSNNPEVLSLVSREARKLGDDTFPWGSLYVRPGLPPRNALHEAAEHATPKFMEKVLEEFPQLKEHINFVTEEGAPVHVAAKRGDADVAAVLAKNGADLSLRDNDELQGYTPLHHACRHTSQGLILLCIRHAPQTITVPDNEGKTPLTLATELGNDLALSLFRRSGLI